MYPRRSELRPQGMRTICVDGTSPWITLARFGAYEGNHVEAIGVITDD